ncbi:hypothetical protein [Cohnella sp. GCM10012308]|uniref:hypothetical protein n=1 Tax=Cohnella sp. GCM10012308 TaxID=3317329 RepID=UPI00361A9E08
MAENAVPYDYIIDADGLKESVTLPRSVQRYMDSVQRRVELMSRMRLLVTIGLSDAVSDSISRIWASIARLTQTLWIVPIATRVDLAMDPSMFTLAGQIAGNNFRNSFEAALDPAALAAKVKTTLEGMQVKIAVTQGENDAGDNGWIKDILTGAAGGFLGDVAKDLLPKRGRRNKPGGDNDPRTPSEKAKPKRKTPRNKESPAPSPGKSFTTRFKDFGKSTIGFGKNTIALGKKAIEKTKNWMNNGPGNGIIPSNGTPTNSVPEKRSLPSNEKSRGFSSSKRGFTGTINQRNLSKAINIPVPKLVDSKLLKTAGKLVKPLGYMATAASIATAKPGEERNKLVRGAVGNAAGTAIGAALGSIVPGAGTLVGGLVGGYVGEKLAEGKVGKAVQGWVSSGSKWVRGLGRRRSKKETTPDDLPVASNLNIAQANGPTSEGHSKMSGFAPVNTSQGLNASPLRGVANIFQKERKSTPSMIFSGDNAPGTTFAAASKAQTGAIAGIGAGAMLGRLGGGAMGQNGLFSSLLPIVEWLKSKLNAPSAPAAVGASSALPLNPGNAQRLTLTPTMQPNPPRQPANPPAPTININIPAGAVQLTVKETEIDYSAITAQVSTRLTASIRQTLENRP